MKIESVLSAREILRTLYSNETIVAANEMFIAEIIDKYFLDFKSVQTIQTTNQNIDANPSWEFCGTKNDISSSSIFCEHANECPAQCPCPPNCYCRVNSKMCANK